VVEWKEDSIEFIKHALSPAKVKTVTLHEAERVATIEVEPDQLSLAIGKAGQKYPFGFAVDGLWKSWPGNMQPKQVRQQSLLAEATKEGKPESAN